MAEAEFVGADDGRLSARLSARLKPDLQAALDHPVRREVLRVLGRRPRPWSIAELGVDLRGLHPSQLRYHLQVLQRLGIVASDPGSGGADRGRSRYLSAVRGDEHVDMVLRVTEKRDRQLREHRAAGDASPLLTMFRISRPVRSIRLGKKRGADVERDR